MTQAVRELLQRVVARSPGGSGTAAVAVIEGRELAWTAAAGHGEEPLFQAGSLSKPLTSALALELVGRSELELDGDVRDRLRSWQPPADAGPVTLRALLGHTAGATPAYDAGYEQGAPLPTITQVLGGVRLDPAATGRYRYSGAGYAIVQQLVEDVTGLPFADAARALLLDPLGMADTTFAQPPPEAVRERIPRADWRSYPGCAAAGVWSTPADLARFVCALLDPGVVARATVEAMTGDHVPLPPRGQWTKLAVFGLARPRSHGLGLFVRDGRFLHFGSSHGFSSVLAGSLEHGTGAVVMTAGCGSPAVLLILLALADAEGWPGIRTAPAPRAVAGLARRASGLALRVLSDGRVTRTRSAAASRSARPRRRRARA